MTVSWILKSKIGTLLLIVVATLQLTACNFQDGFEVVEQNVQATSTQTTSPDSGVNLPSGVSLPPSESSAPSITTSARSNTSGSDGASTSSTSSPSNNSPSGDSSSSSVNTSASVDLSWVAPFEREDENPISPAEIAGYNIYYGEAEGDYINSINIDDGYTDTYTVENLAKGTYYFVITTIDTEGLESDYSPVVTKTI